MKAYLRRRINLCGYNIVVILFFSMILLSTCPVSIVHAQVQSQQQNELTNNGTNVQVFENKKYDVKVEFTTDPNRPTISNYTMLEFSVQHLDGKPIKNFIAHVTEFTPSSNLTFTGSQYYQFNPINVTNGNFSVQYFFPSSGLYRILLHIEPNGVLIDAPFSVFVHNPSFQTTNDILMFGGIAAAAVGGGIVIYFKSRKRPAVS
jgi:hypothetical protein